MPFAILFLQILQSKYFSTVTLGILSEYLSFLVNKSETWNILSAADKG